MAIANIVSRRPVIPGEKGQYGYVRLSEEKGKKTKKMPKHDTCIRLDLHSASGSTSSSVQTSASASGELMYPTSTMTYSVSPQSAPIIAGDASRTTTLSSLEESQEGSEWAIRVGDAPLPAWNKKRGLSQEGALEDDLKRKRVDSGCVFRFHRSVLPHHQPTSSVACHTFPEYLRCSLTLSVGIVSSMTLRSTKLPQPSSSLRVKLLRTTSA